jgi:hypothetical protein
MAVLNIGWVEAPPESPWVVSHYFDTDPIRANTFGAFVGMGFVLLKITGQRVNSV